MWLLTCWGRGQCWFAIRTDEHDLMFISVWNSLDSIKSHFGEDWEQSYLPEGYEEIIDHCSLKHVQIDGALDS